MGGVTTFPVTHLKFSLCSEGHGKTVRALKVQKLMQADIHTDLIDLNRLCMVVFIIMGSGL